ncbi:dienelactone hydrolase family protein [Paenibacillus sp. IHBB 10380]|uniref:dienelactone hydrolase family protein n=1 Tax=Paenibacillus sp. IHBB 10380 TaxID=1566358 RepID=UPI0005CFB7FC|nr:dienelactone hydrolase family protein [Paenibacillus sp. IHBB 10380]AJS60986.1 hypothetical protein UB51_23870 [Paenibacillus sp. IHBB 10380]
MLMFNNDSRNAVIVVHEIYGVNKHIQNICLQFSELQFDVYCPNLLGVDTSYGYDQEQEAYRNFTEYVGFKDATIQIKHLLQQIRPNYEFVLIIGYSVGATCAWLCCEDEYLCDGVIGYYGSRIRDHLDIQPKCPVLLFYSERETAFQAKELIAELETNRKITIFQLAGRHGWCDPYSTQYRKESALIAFQKMVEWFQIIRGGLDHEIVAKVRAAYL